MVQIWSRVGTISVQRPVSHSLDARPPPSGFQPAGQAHSPAPVPADFDPLVHRLQVTAPERVLWIGGRIYAPCLPKVPPSSFSCLELEPEEHRRVDRQPWS